MDYSLNMDIVLLEMQDIHRFYPISLTRGLWDIKTGVYSPLERFKMKYDDVYVFSKRDYIKSDKLPQGTKIFVSPMIKNLEKVPELKKGDVVYSKGEVVCFASEKPQVPENGNRIEIDIPFYSYLYEIVDEIPENLRKDLFLIKFNDHFPEGVYVKGTGVFVHNEAEILGNVFINAEKGPVFINRNTIIEPFTYIEGPAYIGEHCLIKTGTRIQGGVYLGNWTKACGEIEHTIIHSYSNKQHHGFLGHSYIGEWVNLGAGTTNSDLKNNYSNIRIKIFDREVETGLMFLGLLMGDHSKSAINTSFNTGTLVGPFSNIFTRGFPPKFIPPFSWVGEDIEVYDLEKAISTAKVVMGRRDIEMDKDYENMIRKLFKIYRE